MLASSKNTIQENEEFMTGVGYSLENGIWVCAALKTFFSRSPDYSERSHFQNFSVAQHPAFAWNHNFFLKNLHFRAFKSQGKFSALKPIIWSNISSKSLTFDMKSLLQDPKFSSAPVRFQSPYFRLLSCTLMKVEFIPPLFMNGIEGLHLRHRRCSAWNLT